MKGKSKVRDDVFELSTSNDKDTSTCRQMIKGWGFEEHFLKKMTDSAQMGSLSGDIKDDGTSPEMSIYETVEWKHTYTQQAIVLVYVHPFDSYSIWKKTVTFAIYSKQCHDEANRIYSSCYLNICCSQPDRL